MATTNKPLPNPWETTTISIADLLSSAFITSTKLSGSKNYHPWSAAIRTFLTSKDKLRYIEEDKHEAPRTGWAKDNAQIRSWLWNSMEPHVSCNVILLPTAYAVWTSIKETYGLEGNIQRIHELFEYLFLTKQGSHPLHEYYSLVKSEWEELNLYHPYPQDLTIWKHQTEELKVNLLSGCSWPSI